MSTTVVTPCKLPLRIPIQPTSSHILATTSNLPEIEVFCQNLVKTSDTTSKWVQKLMYKEPKLDSAQGCLQKRKQCINQSSIRTSIPPLVSCTVPKFISVYIYVMKSTDTRWITVLRRPTRIDRPP